MKTESKIMKILGNGKEIESNEIAKLIKLTYDTTASHLKKMTNERKLKRTARGKPWNYYYQLNKDYQTK